MVYLRWVSTASTIILLTWTTSGCFGADAVACPDDPTKDAPGVCGCGVPDTDSDNDAIPDCHDSCPDDPAKTEPGACGCGVSEADSDNDGTPDCNDACPSNAQKVRPGICGCAAMDIDSDMDQTPDCLDDCPSDGAKTQPGVCGCGTPDTDHDGDGTPDCLDLCPDDSNKVSLGLCGCGVADVDTDGDGALDCEEACPNDPHKTLPGTCGCGTADLDSDQDGTADCRDQCPHDPNKTYTKGICGCGISDADTDGDRTADCNDGCPNDPNKTHPGLCGCGAPDTDTDGDFTPDCLDDCPTDPLKVSAGQCGCGVPDTDTDSDGTPDCIDGCKADPEKTAPGVCGCGEPDIAGATFAARRMFATSIVYPGNILAAATSTSVPDNGLQGADARCQEVAAAAGLGTQWMAILSDGTHDIRDRVSICGPIFTPDGTQIAAGYNEFFGGAVQTAIPDEHGNSIPTNDFAWTGSLQSGQHASYTCSDWAGNWSDFGETGLPSAPNSNGAWLDVGPRPCGDQGHIYCIEQDPAVMTSLSTPTSVVVDRSVDPGVQLSATARYNYGPPRDFTSQVTWTSSDPNIATIDANGVVSTWSSGQATITASFQGFSSTTQIYAVPKTHRAFVTASTMPLPNPFNNMNPLCTGDTNAWDFYSTALYFQQICTQTAHAAGLLGDWYWLQGKYTVHIVQHNYDNSCTMDSNYNYVGATSTTDGNLVFHDETELANGMTPQHPIDADSQSNHVGIVDVWTRNCYYDFSVGNWIAPFGSTDHPSAQGTAPCGASKHIICVEAQ